MFYLPRQNIFVPPEHTNLFIQSNICRNDFDTGGALEWQVARLAGPKSDQKYRRVNISDLSLGQEGPPAALGMLESPISGPARLSGGAGR